MRVLILGLVTIAGLLAVLVSGHYLFQDWRTLNANYSRFEQLTMSASDMRSLFIAEANQNAFRINSFADGVGVLLGGIIMAIGLHGLCLLPRGRPAAQQ